MLTTEQLQEKLQSLRNKRSEMNKQRESLEQQDKKLIKEISKVNSAPSVGPRKLRAEEVKEETNAQPSHIPQRVAQR